MTLPQHPIYQELVEKAVRSHEKNRNPEGITAEDIDRARLYCYGFRRHTIGTFHATRQVLAARPVGASTADAWRVRADEALVDLANQAMETVPRDFRALLSHFFRYHTGVARALDSLQREYLASGKTELNAITQRFQQSIAEITAGNGISLGRDDRAPVQDGYVVPNLGITIVPLVYGDHHSWNLAYLAGDRRNVPVHRHHFGVEIHLGYEPTHGQTILGTHRTTVADGYAMPVPPETYHGWINTSDETHHVPFIFGSLKYGGWGVFLDVAAQTRPVEKFATLVPREAPVFSQMVFLERAIARAEKMASCWRTTIIPHSVTNRNKVGGLELCLTRVNPGGWDFPVDDFRAVGIVRGEGVLSMAGLKQSVARHDHFGIPAGIHATIAQTGKAPLVLLDATIRGCWNGTLHPPAPPEELKHKPIRSTLCFHRPVPSL